MKVGRGVEVASEAAGRGEADWQEGRQGGRQAERHGSRRL
jgi:hypothetical protein